MRSDMTEPETRLWFALRAKRLNGIKFVRQRSASVRSRTSSPVPTS